MKVDKLVPKVYYEESRDFSYIGRLFEVVFNYMKTGADLVNVNLDDKYLNSNIIDLCALTLGFESKHKYITKDLIGIISLFTELIKNKGTLESITLIIKLLCASQNIKTRFHIEKVKDKQNELLISLPYGLKDVILMEDLFDYILPAGTLYTLSYQYNDANNYENEISNEDSARIKAYSYSNLGVINSNNLNEIEYNYTLLSEMPADWDNYCNNYFIRTNIGTTETPKYIYSRVPNQTSWTPNMYYQAEQTTGNLQSEWSTVYTGTIPAAENPTLKTTRTRKKKES